MICQRCHNEATVHLTEPASGRAARASSLPGLCPQGRSGLARIAAQPGTRCGRAEPDRGQRRRAGRRAGRYGLSRLRHQVHGISGRRPAGLSPGLLGLLQGIDAAAYSASTAPPVTSARWPGVATAPWSGFACVLGCARPSRAKSMKKPRGCETCSARRIPTHDS